MWKPTEQDYSWQRKFLSLMKDGGTWLTSYGAYQVNHRTKTLTLSNLIPGYDEDRRRIKDVCKGIGWKVM